MRNIALFILALQSIHLLRNTVPRKLFGNHKPFSTSKIVKRRSEKQREKLKETLKQTTPTDVGLGCLLCGVEALHTKDQ
jgi:hypothetical protein